MVSLLIVGGDNIQKLKKKLSDHGFDEVIHVNGRKTNMVRIAIPVNVDSILILTDFINHNLSNVIKKRASERSIPIYFAKRSWSSVYEQLGGKMPAARIPPDCGA
ncbi:DUF2325 domain-containing protein [Domibacillus sp. A3M-37]|uniref:DUF2325 domain-containing protein n=1 Tax=Domibacillus sp. A3M-37 TaxID=2962037 RepID=UPI0020B79090|nr:DUF2325 domain-containing protein [Domibacillus sp. A3M-37]MCP3763777.1 DUF2325 domain-containing protein [Domibacillus sp. A3M-37]